MLILGRKIGESIFIGRIKIQIIGKTGGKATVKVSSPKIFNIDIRGKIIETDMWTTTLLIDEKFILNKVIEVTICSFSGSIVRLGFNAPRQINIVREELLERNDNG